MNLKLLVRRNVQLVRCPNCGKAATLRRSRTRNVIERGLKRIKIRPFFCHACGWRGKIFSYKFSKNVIQLIILYVSLMLISAYLVNKFLENYFS